MNKKIDQFNATLLDGLCLMKTTPKLPLNLLQYQDLNPSMLMTNLCQKREALQRYSRHTFHIDGIEYQVLFVTVILKNQIKCTFFKHGKMVKSYTARPKGNHYVKFAGYALIGFILGSLDSYLRWPFWISALMVLCLVSLIHMREIKRLTIKENYV